MNPSFCIYITPHHHAHRKLSSISEESQSSSCYGTGQGRSRRKCIGRASISGRSRSAIDGCLRLAVTDLGNGRADWLGGLGLVRSDGTSGISDGNGLGDRQGGGRSHCVGLGAIGDCGGSGAVGGDCGHSLRGICRRYGRVRRRGIDRRGVNRGSVDRRGIDWGSIHRNRRCAMRSGGIHGRCVHGRRVDRRRVDRRRVDRRRVDRGSVGRGSIYRSRGGGVSRRGIHRR